MPKTTVTLAWETSAEFWRIAATVQPDGLVAMRIQHRYPFADFRSEPAFIVTNDPLEPGEDLKDFAARAYARGACHPRTCTDEVAQLLAQTAKELWK